ncbi:hypothetical protein Mx8p42 [Myxococcus phage Mx8]|uniref:p42 n=1 Tax=Myxococcus phage Mx8 TaxID=49964 RepID=Q94MS7_9CAUD|nr:hypothetical protein Mx8p42 [Myxococcus phage Mx8]AAK94377.1 p42 [Myxococcus phage Mx8]
MSNSPRKHRATGKKPPGGARPGAGRPKGSRNALPYGAVQAVESLSLRVPEGAHPEAKRLADRAFARVVDVLEERVDFKLAAPVLKAASMIREEVCGPIAQKHEVAGKDGQALSISIDLGAAK